FISRRPGSNPYSLNLITTWERFSCAKATFARRSRNSNKPYVFILISRRPRKTCAWPRPATLSFSRSRPSRTDRAQGDSPSPIANSVCRGGTQSANEENLTKRSCAHHHIRSDSSCLPCRSSNGAIVTMVSQQPQIAAQQALTVQSCRRRKIRCEKPLLRWPGLQCRPPLLTSQRRGCVCCDLPLVNGRRPLPP